MKTITIYKDLKIRLKSINTPYGEMLEPILYFKNEIIMNFNPDFISFITIKINEIKKEFKKYNTNKLCLTDILNYKINISDNKAMTEILCQDIFLENRKLTIIKFNDNISSLSIM